MGFASNTCGWNPGSFLLLSSQIMLLVLISALSGFYTYQVWIRKNPNCIQRPKSRLEYCRLVSAAALPMLVVSQILVHLSRRTASSPLKNTVLALNLISGLVLMESLLISELYKLRDTFSNSFSSISNRTVRIYYTIAIIVGVLFSVWSLRKVFLSSMMDSQKEMTAFGISLAVLICVGLVGPFLAISIQFGSGLIELVAKGETHNRQGSITLSNYSAQCRANQPPGIPSMVPTGSNSITTISMVTSPISPNPSTGFGNASITQTTTSLSSMTNLDQNNNTDTNTNNNNHTNNDINEGMDVPETPVSTAMEDSEDNSTRLSFDSAAAARALTTRTRLRTFQGTNQTFLRLVSKELVLSAWMSLSVVLMALAMGLIASVRCVNVLSAAILILTTWPSYLICAMVRLYFSGANGQKAYRKYCWSIDKWVIDQAMNHTERKVSIPNPAVFALFNQTSPPVLEVVNE